MATISAQTLLKNNVQGATGATGPLGFNYTVANSSITLGVSEAVVANTAAGTFTVTLPPTPNLGDSVNIVDGNNFANNNLIVARNGSTIEGIAEDLTINVGGAAVTFVYDGSTWEVFAQIGGQGGNLVTLTGTQTITNKTIDSADNTLTGVVTLTGSQTLTNKTLKSAKEFVTIEATAAANTINYDAITQSVLYYTSNASANWTINLRGNSTTTLNSIMTTGESITVAFLATNGATAYYQSALTIDGSSITPKWQGGEAPSEGNTSSIDAYVITAIKIGEGSFIALESQTQFA